MLQTWIKSAALLISLLSPLFSGSQLAVAQSNAQSSAQSKSTETKPAQGKSAEVTFGAPVTLSETTSLTTAVGEIEKYRDKDILIEGDVKKVCEKKGCWMQVSDGKTEIRMTFKDYGFFVPKDAIGARVVAQGRVIEKVESVKDQKHYLKDAGAPKDAIEAIKDPKSTKSFVASGLKLAK